MNPVVQTIAEQIGPRAFLMMGTRYRIADNDTLIFDIRGSRNYNKVRVTLTPLDTYTVEFIKCRGLDVTKRHEVFRRVLRSTSRLYRIKHRTLPKPMNLQCACCGGNAPARHQWHNRDRGYGVCPRCFNDAVKRHGLEQAINWYGAPGVHHSIDLPAAPANAGRES